MDEKYKIVNDLIDGLFEEAEESLSDWERTFLTDIQSRILDTHLDLTQRQIDAVEKIYNQKIRKRR